MNTKLGAVVTALGLLSSTTVAWADQPAAASTAVAPLAAAVPIASAGAVPAAPVASASPTAPAAPASGSATISERKVLITPQYYSNSVVGPAEILGVGVESTGVKLFGKGHGLVTWDAMGQATTGNIPGQPAPFVGVNGNLEAGLGYRPIGGVWSPYIGADARGSITNVYVPGTDLTNFAAMNYFKYAGTRDVVTGGFSFGASRIDSNSAARLTAFVRETYRFQDSYPIMGGFTDGGVDGDLRIKDKLRVYFEALYGTRTFRTGIEDGETVLEGKAGAEVQVKIFGKQIGLGAAVDVERDQIHHNPPAEYAAYITDPAPNVGVTTTAIASFPF